MRHAELTAEQVVNHVGPFRIPCGSALAVFVESRSGGWRRL